MPIGVFPGDSRGLRVIHVNIVSISCFFYADKAEHSSTDKGSLLYQPITLYYYEFSG